MLGFPTDLGVCEVAPGLTVKLLQTRIHQHAVPVSLRRGHGAVSRCQDARIGAPKASRGAAPRTSAGLGACHACGFTQYPVRWLRLCCVTHSGAHTHVLTLRMYQMQAAKVAALITTIIIEMITR